MAESNSFLLLAIAAASIALLLRATMSSDTSTFQAINEICQSPFTVELRNKYVHILRLILWIICGLFGGWHLYKRIRLAHQGWLTNGSMANKPEVDVSVFYSSYDDHFVNQVFVDAMSGGIEPDKFQRIQLSEVGLASHSYYSSRSKVLVLTSNFVKYFHPEIDEKISNPCANIYGNERCMYSAQHLLYSLIFFCILIKFS